MKKKKVIFESYKVRKGEKYGASMYSAPSTYSHPGTAPSRTTKLSPKAKATLGSAMVHTTPKISEDKNEIQKTAKKELLIEQNKNETQLNQMVEKSKQVLLSIKSTFPFDFFPDEITIDPTKINVVIKNFWGSGSVHSVYIQDVTDVKVESTPFFATLKLVDKAFVENKIKVSFLKKKDAYRARRILQGLVVATRDNLNLAGMDINELAKKVEELGVETETQL